MKSTLIDSESPHRVAFCARLPVSWTTAAEAADEAWRRSIANRNTELLSSLLVLDDAPAEADDDTGNEHWRQLDAKLNMMLSLLSEVIVAQNPLPAEASVSVSASVLEITPVNGEHVPGVGESLNLRLYLSPQFPRCLELTGRVEATQPGRAFTVRLDMLDESSQELLQRYVFRQHRRAIAQARAEGRR